jgi:hypothetical protein
LPIGNYQATIAAINVADANGLPLAADFTLSIPQLVGDWNLDGHVNVLDVLAMQHAVVNLGGYMSSNSLTSAQVLALGDVDGDHYLTNGDMQALLNLLIGGGGSLESNAASSSQNVAAANSLPVTVIDQTEQVAADTDLPATASVGDTSGNPSPVKQPDLTFPPILAEFHDRWDFAATNHVFGASAELKTSKEKLRPSPLDVVSADPVAPLDSGYDWASSSELVRHHSRRDLMEETVSLDALDAIFQSGDLRNHFSSAGKIG